MNCCSADIVNLFRFIHLFGISLFSILSTTERQISAVVAWPDACQRGLPERDDIQEMLWHISEINNINDALLLGEFAYDNGWISSDRITISRNELKDALGWDSEKFNLSLDTLLSIRVSMIDNEKETDAFFLHF